MESQRWFTAANRLVTCCARTRWRLPSITWLINLSSSQHIQNLIFKWLFIFCILVPMTHYASQCPIHSYCLNGGICLYYQSIGELACRYWYNKFIWQYKIQWYIDATDAARDLLVKDVNSRKRWSSSLQLLKVFDFQTLLTQSSPLASGCGAYGYDINQLCAAWTEAPEEMTREQYQVTPNNVHGVPKKLEFLAWNTWETLIFGTLCIYLYLNLG